MLAKLKSRVFKAWLEDLSTDVTVVQCVSLVDYQRLLMWTDGAQLEFCALAFSTSEYLVSISGVPEYKLIIWYVVPIDLLFALLTALLSVRYMSKLH